MYKGAKELKYNMVGQGVLKTYLYPHTQALYDFLKINNYDVRFKNTNQLGSLKNHLMGAHHTRYEYIFLQWSLIHKLKESSKIGLSTINNKFGKIYCLDKGPTNGEILQCLAILTNMGHLPGTFAASRTLLNLLEENSNNIRNGYKKGLDSESKQIFNTVLEEFDIFKVHLLNAIFLMERYRRINDSSSYIDFSINLLKSYLLRKDKSLEKLWSIYDGIRRLAFLILDSTYAPLPFNLSFESINTNISEIFDDIINEKNSDIINALNQINNIIEDSLYMSSESLLTVANYAEQLNSNFKEINVDCRKLSIVRDLLEPPQKNFNEFTSVFQEYSEVNIPERKWCKDAILELKYKDIRAFKELFPKNFVKWENECMYNIGNAYVASGYLNKKNIFKVVYSPAKSLASTKKTIKCFDIVEEAMKLENCLSKSEYFNPNQEENYKSIFIYLLNTIFKGDNFYKLEYKQLENSSLKPYFKIRGTKKAAEKLKKYMVAAQEKLNEDEIHEIKVIYDTLIGIDYKGNVLVFAGATKVFEKNNTTESAEFDGIIYFPYERERFIYIIEAKNRSHGNTYAKKQLDKRLNKLINKEVINYSIENIEDNGAMAILSINNI